MALRVRRNKLTDLAALVLGLGVALVCQAPARADWRGELGTFRVGIVMRDAGTGEAGRLEGFRDAVAETLAMPVEIFSVRDASALIDAMATSRIDYAVFSALGYATAQELCRCVEPVAAPIGSDGASAVRSVLVADSGKAAGIDGLSDVAIAFGPRDSLTGDLAPEAGFRWHGDTLAGSGLDLVSVESTQESLRLLSEGKVGAAFVWDYARPGTSASFDGGPLAWLDEVAPGRFAVLWRSEPVRFGPHAVRRDLPAETKKALKAMLVTLDETAPEVYGAISPELGGGFEDVGADDYVSALAIVSAIGADD